jgi:hypothetical protein
MSSIASIMTLVAALSLTDKLQLNAQLAALMAGGEASEAPASAKAGKAAAKAKKPSARAGKPAAPGTKAWSAFIEHCRATMPERFASAPPKDRMVIAKAIKAEDPEAYKAFSAKYVAEHPASEVASVASSSDAEQAASELIPFRDWGSASENAAWVAQRKAEKAEKAEKVEKAEKAEKAEKVEKAEKAEKPKRVMSDEQKAKMKAGREAAKAAKDAAIAAGETPAPKAKKAASKAPKKATAAPASVGGGGSVAAAAASSPSGAALSQPVFEEDAGLTKVTVGGDEYFLQTATNDLYAIDGQDMGAFVGRYDPATGEIDFDAEPSDE